MKCVPENPAFYTPDIDYIDFFLFHMFGVLFETVYLILSASCRKFPIKCNYFVIKNKNKLEKADSSDMFKNVF